MFICIHSFIHIIIIFSSVKNINEEIYLGTNDRVYSAKKKIIFIIMIGLKFGKYLDFHLK